MSNMKIARSVRIRPTPSGDSCRPRQGAYGLLFNSRRGVAGVVVTILLVLITITAVSLVGGFILNFVKNPGLSPALDCFNLQLESGLNIERACYNSELDEVEVKVARSLDDDLQMDEFVLIVTGTEDSSSWACGQSCGSCDMLASGEAKTFTFSLDDDFGELETIGVRVGTCGVEEMVLKECPKTQEEQRRAAHGFDRVG